MTTVNPLLRNAWSLPAGVTYLNHGSFGPSPLGVRRARQEWSERLERQPMDFYLRKFERSLDEAAAHLADFVGAQGKDLIFVENATAGMNIVAASIELSAGDEILLSDHEYGAVLRLWRNVCKRVGANVVVQSLPSPITSQEEIADRLMAGATPQTKLIVVSHVTSPTATILPVDEICRRAREKKIPVCIDGPHAVAMLPLELRKLDCDFYTASCHKWLSAPFGTGFLYVHPRWQHRMKPAVISWGGSVSGYPPSWQDEFRWVGTRDPAGYLAVPSAIEFLREYGLQKFRDDTHMLVCYARQQITALTGLEPFAPEGPEWYGAMASCRLPAAETKPNPPQRDALQDQLWEEAGIEIPIVHWQDQRFVRVSAYLYNSRDEIDRLVEALGQLLD